MNKEFIWTDEAVKELMASWYSGDNISKCIERFKESKQPKPEWEIIAYQHKKTNEIAPKGTIGFAKVMYDPEYKIFQVYRLSDGDVFTIGDNVKYISGHCSYGFYKIDEFFIRADGKMLARNKDATINEFIEEIGKVKEILFTSQDGKPIHKDDKFYFVDKSFRINEYWADSCWTPVQDGLEFSTKDAAEDYVLHHKPTISLSQVLLRYNLIFWKNDEFAESMKNIAFKAITNDTK